MTNSEKLALKQSKLTLFILLLFALSLLSISTKIIAFDKHNDDIDIIMKEALQICDLETLKKLLSEKKIDPDKFLKISLLSYWYDDKGNHFYIGDCTDTYQNRLVKMAIDTGANTNNPLIFFKLISQYTLVNPETTRTLLTEIDMDLFCHHLNNATTIGFTKSYFITNGIDDLISNPISLNDIRYKNLLTKSASTPKIPRITHHIWVTNEKTKREISEKDIEHVLHTEEIFSENRGEWKHIVWTNDRSLIPNSVKTLEANGIEVREISEIKKYMTLNKKIYELIKQGRWGMASDTIRYEVLKHFGGIYADLNFVFARDLEGEIHKYDFFTQVDYRAYGEPIFLSNCFFGTKPNHPILKKSIELVARNFNTPPEYITNLGAKGSPMITIQTTLEPLIIAYYQAANKNGNIDVIYPPISPSPIEHDRGSFSNHKYEMEFQRLDIIDKHVVDGGQKARIGGEYLR